MKLTAELRSYLDDKENCKQIQEKYTPTQEHEKAILVKWTEELGEL